MHYVYTTMTDGPPFGTAPTKSIIQTLSQCLQLEVRRLEEFFHGRSADDFCGFEDDVGTGAGVVQGLMVMEGIAQVTGNGVQFMIGQVRPDAAGDFDSAGIGRLGLFQVIRLQQAAQDPRIEDGIVMPWIWILPESKTMKGGRMRV